MSPDNIDNLIVHVVEFLEHQDGCNIDFDNDNVFEALVEIFYGHLEHHCTKDRNYN